MSTHTEELVQTIIIARSMADPNWCLSIPKVAKAVFAKLADALEPVRPRVIVTPEELDALPVTSVVLAHWEDGSHPDYTMMRCAEGGASSSGYGLADTEHWINMATWGAILTVVYTPAVCHVEPGGSLPPAMVNVLAEHIAFEDYACRCGWDTSTGMHHKEYPAHVAQELANAGFGSEHAAWARGYTLGLHDERMSADNIGIEFPGHKTPANRTNPYPVTEGATP